MGTTGAGLTREDELDMARNNELTNAWSIVKKKSPWFWNMKALISQRPNVIPMGVGNSADAVDVDAILGDAITVSEDAGDIKPAPRPSLDLFFKDDESSSDASEGETEFLQRIQKRRASVVSAADSNEGEGKGGAPPANKRTPARATASISATKGNKKSSSKKLKMADNFSDIAVAEEVTRQKTLELQIIKAQQDTLKYKAKLTAQLEKERIKAEKAQLNAEMLKFKMRQEHELKLARINRGTLPGMYVLVTRIYMLIPEWSQAPQTTTRLRALLGLVGGTRWMSLLQASGRMPTAERHRAVWGTTSFSSM
ncbi:hypothetical protein L227DRAFT_513249 [Lentinus tigrinus ALCF2SS1-6]|uniref:No apical meristem-associated C-terminal domain-containing protein n=1 Tax=Lentinus tigrinus ALCF2SS1-6 TaxID=1328759 RepID=A0A5C2RQA3_9APHY|nr:hypothetical protein L227DRAFT_513249 [Lentinus tigrinus ALCF2SS1-6]